MIRTGSADIEAGSEIDDEVVDIGRCSTIEGSE